MSCVIVKQKTADGIDGGDWSADVCSSDIRGGEKVEAGEEGGDKRQVGRGRREVTQWGGGLKVQDHIRD